MQTTTSGLETEADLYAQGLAAFGDGRHADAFALLTRAAAERTDLELLNDLAVAAHAAGRSDEARAILRSVLLLDPRYGQALENLAAIDGPRAVHAGPIVGPGPSAGAGAFDAAGYWEKRLSGDYGLAHVGFLGLGLPYNEWLYRVRRDVFRRHARAIRRDWSTARVLDVGSGTGFYVENWLELGVRRLTACDITNAVVNRLAGKYPQIEVRRVDIGSDVDVLQQGAFDAISAFDILFHIVDDAAYGRAMHNLASLLAPGGSLIFTDSFVHAGRRTNRHIIHRSVAETEAAVAAAGLEIVSRRPAFVLMNEPMDARGTRHMRWWNGLVKRLSDDPDRGRAIGAALFPFELAATRLLREGPGTEIMVCRRPAA